MGIENAIALNSEEEQNNFPENLLPCIAEKWNNLAESLGSLEVFDESSVQIVRYPEGGIGVYIEKNQHETLQQQKPPLLIKGNPSPDDFLQWTALIHHLSNLTNKPIVLFSPNLPVSRSDRVITREEHIEVNILKHYIETLSQAGVSAVVTIDGHSPRIAQYCEESNIAVLDISILPFLLTKAFEARPDLRETDLVVAALDKGALPRAELVSELLQNFNISTGNIISMSKSRSDHLNTTNEITGEIDLSGKTVFLADDVISSGGTIIQAVNTLVQARAKQVIVLATRAEFTKQQNLQELANMPVTIVTTNIAEPLNDTGVLSGKLIFADADPLLNQIAESLPRLRIKEDQLVVQEDNQEIPTDQLGFVLSPCLAKLADSPREYAA